MHESNFVPKFEFHCYSRFVFRVTGFQKVTTMFMVPTYGGCAGAHVVTSTSKKYPPSRHQHAVSSILVLLDIGNERNGCTYLCLIGSMPLDTN